MQKLQTPVREIVRSHPEPGGLPELTSGQQPGDAGPASASPAVAGTPWWQAGLRAVASLTIVALGFVVLSVAAALKPRPEEQSIAVPIAEVYTTPVAAYDEPLSLELNGTVVPFREISLTSEVAGRVKMKSPQCRAGHFVTAGTLLLEIDALDYALEVQRLAKEVRQAEFNVQEIDVALASTKSLITLAEEDLALQRREVARLETLSQRGAVSSSELDVARRAELAARNTLTTLNNQVRTFNSRRSALEAAMELSSTRLEKAELDLKRTHVLAPIDGVIVRELVEEDSYVQQGATLVEIEDTSKVEVKCHLLADQLFWLWQSQGLEGPPGGAGAATSQDYQIPEAPARITYSLAGHDYAWDGRLWRYDGLGLDPRTRTIPCRVLVENPRAGRLVSSSATSPTAAAPPPLVRGMFVRVALEFRPASPLASVPIIALRPGNMIWSVDEGHLKMEKVSVVRLLEELAVLELNRTVLQVGDRVITSPLPAPQDGMPVQEVPGVGGGAAAAERESQDPAPPGEPSTANDKKVAVTLSGSPAR